jgi:hypothetical protein
MNRPCPICQDRYSPVSHPRVACMKIQRDCSSMEPSGRVIPAGCWKVARQLSWKQILTKRGMGPRTAPCRRPDVPPGSRPVSVLASRRKLDNHTYPESSVADQKPFRLFPAAPNRIDSESVRPAGRGANACRYLLSDQVGSKCGRDTRVECRQVWYRQLKGASQVMNEKGRHED